MATDQSDRHHLLTFAARWSYFGGGPPDEIYTAFGISPRRFYRRLADTLEQLPDEVIEPSLWVTLHQQCTRELIGSPLEKPGL